MIICALFCVTFCIIGSYISIGEKVSSIFTMVKVMELSIELTETDKSVVRIDDLYDEYSRLIMRICVDMVNQWK